MEEIEIDILTYVNHQNQTLFNQLSEVYDVKLYLSPKQKSWCVENNTPNIRTPKDDGNIPSFTHELLHLYLDYLGMTSKVYIFENILNVNVILSLNRFIYDHIYNVTCHKKMYPYFQRMGFKDIDFVQKTSSFFNQFDFTLIQIFKGLNIFSKLWISQFIGHTLSLMNDVVEVRRERNRRFLYQLSKLDRELYRIIYLFDSKWSKQVDLNCQDNFRELSDSLLIWLTTHKKLRKVF